MTAAEPVLEAAADRGDAVSLARPWAITAWATLDSSDTLAARSLLGSASNAVLSTKSSPTKPATAGIGHLRVFREGM